MKIKGRRRREWVVGLVKFNSRSTLSFWGFRTLFTLVCTKLPHKSANPLSWSVQEDAHGYSIDNPIPYTLQHHTSKRDRFYL